ncbi:MAG: hypothetical protein CVV32_04150 [Methanomicrobiales archaeon HGW-Methanomicrobiales-3]|nr:MAG: hypothetical protein CVV32_04150 [Methanomicrobiales archaeon HGW-Methanomicrobiales-3]
MEMIRAVAKEVKRSPVRAQIRPWERPFFGRMNPEKIFQHPPHLKDPLPRCSFPVVTPGSGKPPQRPSGHLVPGLPPIARPTLTFDEYFSSIFVLHGLANQPESPGNEGTAPDTKPLYGIPPNLHGNDPGGGKSGQTEPCTGPDPTLGETLFWEILYEGEKGMKCRICRRSIHPLPVHPVLLYPMRP